MPDKKEEQQEHIPTSSKVDKKEDENTGTGGLLSSIGDPAGKVLNTALRPLGAPLEKGVTGPLGNAVGGSTRGVLGPLMGDEQEKSEVLGGKNKDSYEGNPSIAGKEQTGGNPLGLDQTGRWGFEGEGDGKLKGDGVEKKESSAGNPLGL